ncbi:galactose oxidase early set domain-containing protein [Streptomyces sp. NBC_01235]|uniref:galactose oxidase early set domain-containing protein n=1 Tax=Streptomyces sp. NBC_01235 TaxID=2903788 RepID=UPI002E1345EB|nr:galactose oxidase early set domain-containing protein [Streptomyces sp. NBC_01235]
MSRRNLTGPSSRRMLSAAISACAVSALTLAVLSSGPAAAHEHGGDAPSADRAQVDPDEATVIGKEHAEEHATTRRAVKAVGEYPQSTRTERLKALGASQAKVNADFDAMDSGRFREYFQSPDFAAHIAMLPTGKVLLFSFERIESNPQKEPAPTDTIGKENAGRAYLWDPAKGTGPGSFTKVTPPVINMPDGLNQPRPAPFFCAGHSFLPNGMLGVFGGNLGGNGGSGAKLSLVFDPWEEKWYQNQDMVVGRWYPSVVTGADGRQLIMSGQSELGWGTPTSIVERFPVLNKPVPTAKTDKPEGWAVERFKTDAPFKRDYPHLFSLRDGKIYGLGRNPEQQWKFDVTTETRTDLAPRPDNMPRNYGSAVPLPAGFKGPDSVLVLGGDRNDANTYQLVGGQWSKEKARAFGRTQDDTLLMPDATLMTVNGAFDIRDYGNGPYNPNADLKYRQIELRDEKGNWKLGPAQRLPRGYHSNAVVLPDGRVMVTGDELQQLANDPDITDDMNGSIEIYEPAYLQQGSRPHLGTVFNPSVGYNEKITVNSNTAADVTRAVLLAPTTATHSVNTSQRHLDLRIKSRSGSFLELQAPPSANAAPPGYYMLFLLNEEGVPSTAGWVQLKPASGGQTRGSSLRPH